MAVGAMLAGFWDYMYNLPPVYILHAAFELYMDFLMDRVVLMLLSFFVGMAVMLGLQFIFLWRYYWRTPPQPPPKLEQKDIELPEVLRSRLGKPTLHHKEDCVWFNFLTQFLFSELRDSLQLRRFLTRKIHVEFEEVLRSRSGVLVDELFLRDFALGDKFPVVMSASVENSEVENDIIQTLDLKANIVYDGGFQIAIDAALPFGRMAFVAVKILKLRGLMRFRFTLKPFSHWSMAFYEEPEVDLDVVAHLDGRPMPKLRNIIANQIRRIIRKKHTLPMFKMRYKPFFLQRPESLADVQHIVEVDGVKVGTGVLEVTLVSASRLPSVAKGAKVYCTVSVDELPWRQLMLEKRKKKTVVTLELVKKSSDQTLGFTVKDEFLEDRLQPAVLVEQVLVGSPAHLANVKEGDILLGISGNKVVSAKLATKTLKVAKDRIQIQMERDLEPDTHISRDATSMMEFRLKVAPLIQVSEEDDTKSLASDSSSASCTPSNSPARSSSSLPNNAQESKESGVRKSVMKPATENPRFDQKFIFSVNPSHTYLNICVWSRGGDRSGQTELISSSKKDVLIGYVSVKLEDIYLHCLVTLSGRMQDRIKLKHGHFKTEAELMKTWSIHKGWDPNLMYGDISLNLAFHPSKLTAQQRLAMTSCRESGAKIQKRLDEQQTTANGTARKEKAKDTTKGEGVVKNRDLNEGHHQFDSTTFITATFCDYCGKKIWMKEAFKCRTCSMVCHKKCLVKCLVNTFCTEDGVKKRDALDEAWEPLTSVGKLKHSMVVEESEASNLTDDLNLEDMVLNTPEIFEADSARNLTDLIDGIYVTKSAEETKADSLPIEAKLGLGSNLSKFQVLREQTERMKENVVRHLKKTKMPSGLNDKAIMAAKETGARLFTDLDPILRKDKLEEMIAKLDDQLKQELQNKHCIESQIKEMEQVELTSPLPKRRSDIKTLSHKALKSSEKLDAMRLLMLQYCSGLQSCIKSLEREEHVVSVVVSDEDKSEHSSIKDVGAVKVGKSSMVRGFVQRAGTSMKEKVFSFRRDLVRGRGGKVSEDGKPIDDVSSKMEEKNNSHAAGSLQEPSAHWPYTSVDDVELIKSSRSRSEGEVRAVLSQSLDAMPPADILAEVLNRREVTRRIGNGLDIQENGGQHEPDKFVTEVTESHTGIEIRVDYVDKEAQAQGIPIPGKSRRSRSLPRGEEARLSRSKSDSGLETTTMANLRPEDILKYRGTSTPKLFLADDSDSDSDYLVIDSSDEPIVTDSSDDDEVLEVAIKKNGELLSLREEEGDEGDNESDDGRGQHRPALQQMSFQV